MSRLSRITCSKNTRLETGLSSIWVSENSAWVRQPSQPLTQQRLDLVFAEPVADRLHRYRIIDRGEPVV